MATSGGGGQAVTSSDEEEEVVGFFSCAQCPGKSFKNRPELINHKRVAHAKLEYLCPLDFCKVKCLTDHGLRKHFTQMHRPLPYGCLYCSKRFSTEQAHCLHQDKHHDHVMCSYCEYLFEDQAKLDDHQKIHDPADIARGVPKSKRYIRSDDLDPERPFMCVYPDCYAAFGTKTFVVRHIKEVHEGTPVACDFSGCSRVLKNPATYAHHKKLHNKDGKTRPICDACDRDFSRIYELKRHQKLYCKNKSKDAEDAIESIATGLNDPAPAEVDEVTGQDLGAMAHHIGSQLDQVLDIPVFLSDDAHTRIRDIFTRIVNFIDGAHLTRLPQSPSPASILVLGNNLLQFRDAQRIEPLLRLEARSLELGAKATLDRFIENNKPSRQLRRKLLVEGKQVVGYKIFNSERSEDSQNFPITDGNSFDKKSWQVVGSHLLDLCSRIPTTLSLLSDATTTWCLSAARVMALAHSEQVHIRLCKPVLSSTSYKIVVNGYNIKKGQPWATTILVPIHRTNDHSSMLWPDKDRVVWYGDDNRLSPTYQLSSVDDEIAYDLAQYFAFRYNGYIGTTESCLNDYVQYSNQFWSAIVPYYVPLQPQPLARITSWQGDAFFVTRQHAGATIFTASREFVYAMQGGGCSITLFSTAPEKVFPVADAMLRALELGHDHDTVWGVGCRQADFENYDIEVTPLVNIKGLGLQKSRKREICAECVELVVSNDLQLTPGYRDYSVCSTCSAQWKRDMSAVRALGGALAARVLQHLRKENAVAETGKTEAQLKEETRTIMKYIESNFQISAWEYIDVYADQVLSLSHPRYTSWDGCRLNALGPSVEAVDPVTIGTNGKTAYHVEQNIMVTSDALNRMKRHFPAIVLHIIRVVLNACETRNKALFDSAIALCRMYVHNNYAYAFLGRAQQKFRVGQEPPSNMADIQTSFRVPKLLDSTTSDQEVYRYLSQRRSISPSARQSWKHPHHNFLYNQIELALKDVCGDDDQVEELRPFVYREDSAGNRVLFPFLHYYSVVEDFTNWDLFELLSVRAIRNVTKCQLPHTRTAPLSQYGPEKLFLTIGHLWIRMLKTDKDAGAPKFAWGTDECGLPLMPTINSGFCASLGHHEPGKVEYFGLEGVTYENEIDYTSSELIKFDLSKCNMRWETQFTNTLKYKYNFNSLKNVVLPQMNKIRLLESTGTINVLPAKYYTEYTTTTEGLRNPWSDHETVGSPDSFGFSDIDLDAARELKIEIESFEQAVRSDTGYSHQPPQASWTNPPQPSREIVSTRRNMTNIENSCYISVVIQVLANIAEFMYCLQQCKSIQPSTGRPSTLLVNLKDPDGKKHERVCDRLGELTSQLRGPDLTGSKLPHETTIAFRTLLGDLKTDWSTKGVFDTKHESASFMLWLLSVVDTVQDCSPNLNKPDIWYPNSRGFPVKRPPWTEQEVANLEHQLSIAEQEPAPSLQSHIYAHWTAYLASGHDSITTRVSTIQVVQFEECNDATCLATLRTIDYRDQLMFVLKDAHLDGTQYDSTLR